MHEPSLADETRSAKPSSTILIAALAGISAFVVVLAAWFLFLRSPSFYGTVVQPPYAAPDFSLTSGSGDVVHLSDYQGKVVVLFFGYTSCPDVCPTTLLQLKHAMEQLGSKADDIQVIFVSIDPKRDTPERVGTYASNFDPNFIGVTGTQEQIRTVVVDYGAYFEYIPQDNPDDYLVIHSANLYVVDRQGQMTVQLPPESNAKDIAHDLGLMLRRG